MKQTFYSNGKLFITGEYVVLDGATAFALPTKFGQNLTVETGSGKKLQWKSYDSDGSIWYDDQISFDEIVDPRHQSADSVRNTLIQILHQAYRQNPQFIKAAPGYSISTALTFPKLWGLGTSSTLINNIAQWLQLDAFELLQNSFGGSGYDIACAQNDTAILYRLDHGKPVVKPIDFNPEFADQLYFVYLNRKQNSKAAIASYKSNDNRDLQQQIRQVDAITLKLLNAKNSREFATQLQHHETILSGLLQMKTVKETQFADFDGTIKSLGGWGGDFVLAVSSENPTAYFEERGFKTVIPYSDMIL